RSKMGKKKSQRCFAANPRAANRHLKADACRSIFTGKIGSLRDKYALFVDIRSPDGGCVTPGRAAGVRRTRRTGAARRTARFRRDLERRAHVVDQLCAYERARDLSRLY